MFIAVYEFKVKEGLERQFKRAWLTLTLGIYQHEGSLGSRLHKNQDGTFVAYAQWPDRYAWEHAGDKPLPNEFLQAREQMHEALIEARTVYQLEVDEDYLQGKTYSG